MECKNTLFQIELTNYCNGNCRWCGNKTMKRERGYMSMDLIKQIIEKIKDRQDYILLHHCGESLLHPNFVEIVELFYKNGIRTGVHTNGSLLSKEVAESHLQDIRIQMNRFYPYEKIEEFVKLARKGMNIEVVIINLPDQKIDSKKIVDWANKLGVRILALAYERPFKVNGKFDCCFKENNECKLLKNNQYRLLWNGELTKCLKDFENETACGYLKDLDTIKRDTLCPY